MKKLSVNLGWEKRSTPVVKKPVLKDFMNKQIATQPQQDQKKK